MAKSKQLTIEELQAKIKALEEDLAFEKDTNRRILNLPNDAPKDIVEEAIPWSTEWMQKEADEVEIVHGAITRVYNQRIFKLLCLKGGDIVIRHHYGKSARGPADKYSPISHVFTIETFFMMMEIMEFAEKEFGLNRKEVINKLTNGEGVIIKKAINNF